MQSARVDPRTGPSVLARRHALQQHLGYVPWMPGEGGKAGSGRHRGAHDRRLNPFWLPFAGPPGHVKSKQGRRWATL